MCETPLALEPFLARWGADVSHYRSFSDSPASADVGAGIDILIAPLPVHVLVGAMMQRMAQADHGGHESGRAVTNKISKDA